MNRNPKPMTPEARAKGRANHAANAKERREARIEDFDFLVDGGATFSEAAERAGFPSLEAAEIALRRAGNPLWRPLNAECQRRRYRASRDPKHVSEVMGEFLDTLGGPRG
ncbi:MAG: hypothetical protein HOQ07_11930 [Sinomonas sp.]|nr:hypothetical protein [Sinomonas sp.]